MLAAARSTVAVDHAAAESVITALYREMDLVSPDAFLWYPSPVAAFGEHTRWLPNATGVVTRHWEFDLPRCDPDSNYRKWCRWSLKIPDPVDLSVRWSAFHRRGFRSRNVPEAVVPLALLDLVWDRVQESLGPGDTWCDWLASGLESWFPEALGAIEVEADREAPALQEHVEEWFCVGPMRWVVAEAACTEACATKLGIPIPPEHRNVLAGIVGSCGPVYAFERLCIMCERPVRVDLCPGGTVMELEFPDGRIVE